MHMSSASAIRLQFVDAEPTAPDPAARGAVVRQTIGSLRSAGEQVDPVYTGEKSGADLFLWVFAAAGVAQTLVALPELALKVAELLTAIKKLRGDKPDDPPPAQQITLVIRVEGATATLPTASTPSDAALLSDLLAQTLPAQIDPAAVTVNVQVPPTPPNEI